MVRGDAQQLIDLPESNRLEVAMRRKSEHWWTSCATMYLPSAKSIDLLCFAASPKVQQVTDRSTGQ